jgi:hypothetical protein
MALVDVAIYFRNGAVFGITDSSVGSLQFDLLLEEKHSRNSAVTERAIEDGSNISDHIQNEMESGDVTGLISNFSINCPGLTSNRSQDAFNLLEKIWNAKILFTMVTVLKVYENVAITSLAISRSADTGEALEFEISFRRVKKVKLKTVQFSTPTKPGEMTSSQAQQAANEQDLGKQVTK